MRNKKKGVAPIKENNTQTRDYTNRFLNICLLDFAVFFILLIIGKNTGSEIVTGIALGIGLVILQISILINKED